MKKIIIVEFYVAVILSTVFIFMSLDSSRRLRLISLSNTMACETTHLKQLQNFTVLIVIFNFPFVSKTKR